MTIRAERESSDEVRPQPDDRHPAQADSVVKPRWNRPEITSFKPISDAQGVSYRIGDGISNLS